MTVSITSTAIHSRDASATVLSSSRVGHWSVLRTRSRHEQILIAELTSIGIEAWTPLVEQEQVYGAHVVKVRRPLFPGYVFLHGRVGHVDRATATGRVTQVIALADQRRIEWELTNLRLAIAHRARLDACVPPRDGRVTEVCDGELVGLQGLTCPGVSRDRLVLEVRELGLAAAVSIDAGVLVSIH